jgi:hypothetical protein
MRAMHDALAAKDPALAEYRIDGARGRRKLASVLVLGAPDEARRELEAALAVIQPHVTARRDDAAAAKELSAVREALAACCKER